MKILSATKMVSWSMSVSGGSMTSGPNKGEHFAGTIITDVPFDEHVESIPDTVLFSERPHVFDNLGDVEHFKVTGTVYVPSNNGNMALSSVKSVFGPLYQQEGGYSDLLCRCTDGIEYYVSKTGRYNDDSYGEWYFGFGSRRVGNIVELAIGQPDLANKPKKGSYQLGLAEFKLENGTVYSRSTGMRRFSRYRTSEFSPFQALDSNMETLMSRLSEKKWSKVPRKSVISAGPISSEYVQDILSRIHPSQVFPDLQVDWGTLAADAYSSVDFFKSNGIAYAKDMINLRKDAADTLSLLKSFGKAGKLASKAANLFLTFYYGWKLTLQDTQELINAHRKINSLRSNRCKATSQRSWGAHGATYKATFQCYFIRNANVSGLEQFIVENDLGLTPDNLWDLVPFSFVVDWFINIGGVLETLSDYHNMTQVHHVVCSGRSIKAIRHTFGRQLSSRLVGDLFFSYYKRWYTEGPVTPTFQFSNSVNPLNHWVEGTALIVSRR